MKQETYDRLKKEFPVIFTASVVSLLSSTLYFNNPLNLFTKEVFNMVGQVFVWALIASAIIYGFYAGIIWAINK